ncbi:response regulator transcription factor [Candidatus Gracilibacteria bacterium]|nr:response regulator transcription factor [Candidatus Gracilibacteria bacterium]
MNFLIIEDDVFLATKLKYLFDKRDATNIVTVVNNYLDFLDEISIIKIYDVILLDINLGDKVKSGYDVLKIIREKSSHIPVIIVSGIDDIMNMSKFFSLGASDYIIKPFRFEELEIRVLKWFKNNFLKLDNLNNNNIFYNGLLYDIDKNEFYFNGKNIVLTKKNKYLLYIFITNKEIFLSMNFIDNKLFGNNDDFKIKNIRVYIFRLRKILKILGIDNRIKNIRGEGYIFKKR